MKYNFSDHPVISLMAASALFGFFWILFSEISEQHIKANMLVVSGGFFTVCTAIIVFRMYQHKKIRFLKKYGKEVSTVFLRIAFNHMIEINGRKPFQVITQWTDPDTGQERLFVSKYLYFHPPEFNRDEFFDVYIHPEKPEQYYLDVSHIKQPPNAPLPLWH